MKLLQIVPRLKPIVCGVGDYSLELAREWRMRHGIETSFLVVDPAWNHGKEVEGFQVRKLNNCDAGSLTEAMKAFSGDAVVVQYSGYGFHKRGAPLWLPAGLRQAAVNFPILSMFHELFASGPVTSSAFWYGLAQKASARGLARLSAHVLTNRQDSQNWLEAAEPRLRGKIRCLPVLSNLGETAAPVPPSQREALLLLFQPPAAESPFWGAFERMVKHLRPTRVIAAGRCKWLPHGQGIEQAGLVTVEEAARLFAKARWLLFDYYDGYLGKSGIFAAGAAHGVASILARPNQSGADGLEQGCHYVTADEVQILNDPARLDSNARALWDWYQGHSIRATASAYIEILKTAAS